MSWMCGGSTGHGHRTGWKETSDGPCSLTPAVRRCGLHALGWGVGGLVGPALTPCGLWQVPVVPAARLSGRLSHPSPVVTSSGQCQLGLVGREDLVNTAVMFALPEFLSGALGSAGGGPCCW